MGFLSGLAHLAGDVVGPAAEAAGAVTSLGGLAHNGVATSLTNAGHAITNPNVTLNSNGFFSGNGAWSYHPPASGGGSGSNGNVQNNGSHGPIAPNVPATQSQLTTTGGVGGNNNSAALQQLMQAYDQNIGMYQNDANTLQGYQGADTSNVNKQYNDQSNTYNDQYNSGMQGLQQQTKTLNDDYTRSLQQLGNNIRNQYQGEINALGTGGAGDSSAAQMAAYALAQEQNLNRGYMNTDLNNQLGQIGIQTNSLHNAYKDEVSQLQDQYQSALADIAKTYGSQLQQINHNIQATQAEKASANAYLGQWAGQQLQNLDSNIMSQAQATNAKYAGLANQPAQSLSYQPDFKATAITTPQVSAQAQTSQQTPPSAALLAPGYNANNNQNQQPLF